ncbi:MULTISPECIES: PadR family transcriptional regulator [unclassified Solwaraspora]|uniref:PadR family transcriptional regulator n=1 Tax=unclassified Solwaraspora TaxID=2627926 RepID=UPI00248CE089|nr:MULTISPECIES: PadR family transcriptional regulator [unclassified Solwaraspora]WBB98592.1 PadR family transcriptional regulator [Solwaraspora sp. WMMA2059]WBC22856.1 PadR family transcriptional regulator [Solwaraspora sp. WMMA2080]WJK35103.1 PadR family transcriptional regulator [Solwaraspora sp. WMMA2065]
MSIRHGLLALLDRGPMHGYQLRAAFEEATGGAWPLNIGQVYTTLSRLERDGLVHALAGNAAGQRPFAITDAGRDALAGWFSSPVGRVGQGRDELTVKIALALSTPRADVRGVVAAQRAATLDAVRELTRARARSADVDRVGRLVLDAMLFRAEAEIRWLDHCETSLLGPGPVRAG